LSAALGCSLLMAAAGNDDAALTICSLETRSPVGGRSASLVDSIVERSGWISISDKDNHQKALLIYRPKTGVTALTLFDAKGNPAFEAKHSNRVSMKSR